MECRWGGAEAKLTSQTQVLAGEIIVDSTYGKKLCTYRLANITGRRADEGAAVPKRSMREIRLRELKFIPGILR